MTEKAALLDSINPSAHEVFEGAGFEVVTFEKSATPEELAELTAEARVLGVRSGPEVPAEAMGEALEAIAVFGVGVNHIDRSEAPSGMPASAPYSASERGIPVFNSAHENTRSVAELVIGSTFSLLRDFGDHNRAMHEGRWTKSNGREIRGKTMGIIGYGNIGAQVSVLAEAVGMDVVAFDPKPPGPPQGRARMASSMEEVLAEADVLTLHAPGSEHTRHMINSERLGLMKDGAFLINAARGDLVDYQAVADALDSGKLGGVATDVYTDASVGYTEPAKKGDDFDHVLRGHERVLLLPHIGGSTAEAQRSIGQTVASRVVDYLATGSSRGAVNIPELSLPPLSPGTGRLLHMHDNEPGVMGELGDLLADARLNVARTVQETTPWIGYVAFDVEGEVPAGVVASAGALKEARRARSLFEDYES